VPGTAYAIVELDVPPVTSGLAVGALATGIGSILFSMVVLCLGLVGMNSGWGGWAAGAFGLPSGLAGLAAMGLGLVGMRQIRRTPPPPAMRFTGRGLAIAGLTCGAVGLVGTLIAVLLSLALQLG
jgi:hypothetical protein